MLNNDQLLTIITTIVIFLVLISIIVIIFIIKTKNKISTKELEKKQLKLKFQEEILSKIILTQEAERKRIARNLHDDISSKLVALSLNLYLLQSKKTKEIEKEEIINNIVDINKKVIETSRKIAHELYPPILLKLDLEHALIELVSDYNKTKSVLINLIFECSLKEDSETQLQIYRIIQELITNSIRHGKASNIIIKFAFKKGVNTCFYKDNGVGFDCTNLDDCKGMGLFNIENRIQNIKGEFEIFSKKNKGFTFKFTF